MITLLSIKHAVIYFVIAMAISYLSFNINARYPHFITILIALLIALLAFNIIISSIIGLIKSAKNLKGVNKFQVLFLMPYIFF